MKCPRRAETVGMGDDHPFKVPAEDVWREDGTCSWCGSMQPEKFFEAIEAGAEVVPTDKNYKAYVRADGSADQKKLYFQHFETTHKDQLIKLLNERKIRLALPGRFYVLPFFVERA